MANNDRKH